MNLKNYNSFKIEAIAKYFVEINSEQDFIELLESSEYKESTKTLFLWWWSNILLTDYYEGIVIHNKIKGKETISQDNNNITIKVWGWEIRHDWVMRTCEQNYAWLENLAYIPWSVWAAPIQNIWAYWVEAKDNIISVEWIDIHTKKMKLYTNKECTFWYRDSIFKNTLKSSFFVTRVSFWLKKTDFDNNWQTINYIPNTEYWAITDTLKNNWIKNINPLSIAKTVIEIRSSKLPDWNKIWTAWSFFKNPIITKESYQSVLKIDEDITSRDVDQNMVKLSAWQLIEKCWFKWYKLNNAWVYDKHALVLVNYWNAKGSDIVNLANIIQKKVYITYWITIEPEVNYIS